MEPGYKQLDLSFDEPVEEVRYDVLLEPEPLRKEVDFANVQRVFEESKAFQFSAPNKIRQPRDVAYIFKQLETAAVENAFAVLVKDGKPTVIHLGMGRIDATYAPMDSVVAADKKINADKVYFIHNHPSGNIKASVEDIRMLDVWKSFFGEKMQPGIIINTRSGLYGEFDSNNDSLSSQELVTGEEPQYPVKLYSFSKLVFEKEYQETDKVQSSHDVARFVSSQRLGKRSKLSYLVMSNGCEILANIHTQRSRIQGKDIKDLSQQIIQDVVMFGGNTVISYGSAKIGRKIIESLFSTLRQNNIRMLDHIQLLPDVDVKNALGLGTGAYHYMSASDEGWINPFNLFNLKEPELSYGEEQGRGNEVEDAGLSEEERGIVERAKVDGTYLKAPNGQPTKLSQKQWAQVRTKAFKDWFGDWEKTDLKNNLLGNDVVARLNGNEFEKDGTPLPDKVGAYYEKEYNGKVFRENFGEVILDRRSVKDSLSHGIGRLKSAAFAAVPDIIKNGRIIDEKSEWKGRNQESFTFAAPVRIGNENYVGIVIVTRGKGTKKNRFYLHEVMVQKNLQNKSLKTDIEADSHSGDIAKILQNIVNAKEASKVVDKNGEPLVVYHGTAAEFNTFQSEKGMYWFAKNSEYSESMAEERGGERVIDVYLNMKNPYSAALEPGMFTNPTFEKPIIKEARDGKYDGVILRADTDNELLSDTFYVAFSPTQIKSATDNVGTFEVKNADIRFRRGETVEEKGNLVAVHNLSEDKIRQAFDLGGFPMPSIAITKSDIGHTEFGDISLVFDKESINPADKQNKVYGEDAWTPTFPEIGLKINNDVAESVQKKISEILGDQYGDLRASLYLDEDNLSETANRYDGDMAAAFADKDFMKQAYRKEKGLDKNPEREDKDYRKWIDDIFKGIIQKRGIRNNKDFFTPSGIARKWEDLYDNITLDNVVNAMKKKNAKGGQGLFGANIFGAAQEDYKSIDAIRTAARKRLRNISDAEIAEDRKAINDRLSAIKIPGAGDKVSDIFDMIENIQNAVSKSHTAKGIYNYLLDFYPDMTMEVAKEIEGVVKDIQKMGARYFEAKPYRAVDFGEVKLAVVPDNIDKSILERLKQLHIPVETYEHGNNEQRVRILNDVTEKLDLRFRFIGEKGAANLDKAEEATTRLDNLAVAREMEEAGKDAKVVKMATGWERGADGKWRYETEDNLDGVELKTQNELEEEYRAAKKEADKAQRKYSDFYKNPALYYRASKKNSTEENERLRSKRAEAQKYLKELIADYNRLEDIARKLWERANDGIQGVPLPDVIGKNHPLLQAYPEMNKIKVSFYPRGRYVGSRGMNGFYHPWYNSIFIATDSTKEKMRSTLGHELQHAIQHIEGFAIGSNVSDFEAQKAYKEKQINLIESKIEKLERQLPGLNEEWTEKHDKIEEEINSLEDRKLNLSNTDNSFLAYKHVSGEVEARNVQSRMNMTPEERRNSLAAETEDVAREEQIFLNETREAAASIPYRKASIHSQIKDMGDKLHTPIRIVKAEDVRHDNPDMEKRMREAKGWFNTKSGEVVVILENHTSMEDVTKTVLHEVVAHKGLRGIMSEKTFQTMCESVFLSMPPALGQSYLRQYGTPAIAGEEYMAHVAENGASASMMSSITSAIKVALNSIGIQVNYTNKEIQALLKRSLRHLEKNPEQRQRVASPAAKKRTVVKPRKRGRGI